MEHIGIVVSTIIYVVAIEFCAGIALFSLGVFKMCGRKTPEVDDDQK